MSQSRSRTSNSSKDQNSCAFTILGTTIRKSQKTTMGNTIVFDLRYNICQFIHYKEEHQCIEGFELSAH